MTQTATAAGAASLERAEWKLLINGERVDCRQRRDVRDV